MNQFAFYACPTGDLVEQIQKFMRQTQEAYGVTKPHPGLPYCTLIDLFEETTPSVPIYAQSLDRAYKRSLRSRPNPVLILEDLTLTPACLELTLTAPWLQQLMVNFACTVKSPTRKAPLRLQDHLGILLAQGYSEDQALDLYHLAQAMIPLKSPSHWEMRFYQWSTDQGWILRQSWELGMGGWPGEPSTDRGLTEKPSLKIAD